MSSAATGDPNWVEVWEGYYSPGDLLQQLGVDQAPVPITRVADRLGVTVYLVDDVEWHGAVEASTKTGEASIYVNERTSRHRRRFTVAHELGHLILHDQGPNSTVRYRDMNFLSDDEEEKQANGYAAKLLMPAFLVEPLVDYFGVDVPTLAETFDVSQKSMRYRLQNMGYLR